MPANVVKTQADERRWERAKRITKKEYGGIESKGKWPVVMKIFKNIKKGEQEKKAEAIFWAAFSDELEKCGMAQQALRLGQSAKELVPKLVAAWKSGKATGTQMNILKKLREVQRKGGNLQEYVKGFTA